jgi:hypothetical protein
MRATNTLVSALEVTPAPANTYDDASAYQRDDEAERAVPPN